jgi:hypothetical protein
LHANGIVMTSRQRTGVTNGYRHCLWSAVLTMDLPDSVAQGFLTRHEGNDTSRDHFIDVYNNVIGTYIGMYAKSRNGIIGSCVADTGELNMTGG